MENGPARPIIQHGSSKQARLSRARLSSIGETRVEIVLAARSYTYRRKAAATYCWKQELGSSVTSASISPFSVSSSKFSLPPFDRISVVVPGVDFYR